MGRAFIGPDGFIINETGAFESIAPSGFIDNQTFSSGPKNIVQSGAIGIAGGVTVAAPSLDATVVYWRMPTNAPIGTVGYMMVFQGNTGLGYSILAQNQATVASDGYAYLQSSAVHPSGFTKVFAMFTDYADSAAQVPINGGPGMAFRVSI